MQAVVVILLILEQQRCWQRLARLMAALQKRVMRSRIFDVDAELLVPLVRDRREMRIKRRAQLRNDGRQRIGEVLVFAAPEAVATHDHTAAKRLLFGVRRGELATLLEAEHALGDSVSACT